MGKNLSISQKFLVRFGVVLLILAVSGFSALVASGTSSADTNMKHQPIVEELIRILQVNPELKGALEESITKAERLDAPTLTEYYQFLDEMVTMIPTDRNLLPKCLEFYYLIDQSPQGELQEDDLFQQWTLKFIRDWGNFLDTTESAEGLETLYTNPIYQIDDYFR
ncbi:unnamed protein product, partial [marine sediment metagenome]